MGACWTHIWREEFKVHKLHLLTAKPELLLQPRWDIPPLIWLLYRGFMLVYTVSWLIYMVLLFNTSKFLIYLSHISYCLMVIYYLVAFCNLAWAFLKWLLHSVMGCYSLTVTFVYWTLIHTSNQVSLTNIHIHAINSIQTTVDLLLSSTPVHLTHLFYTVLAGVLYVIFVVIYWLLGCTNGFGQPYIYSILDLSGRPLVATLCILGVPLLCLPSCHFVLWNMQLLREWVVSRERVRRMALKREVWWWVKVSGGATFHLVPSLDPAASVFEA